MLDIILFAHFLLRVIVTNGSVTNTTNFTTTMPQSTTTANYTNNTTTTSYVQSYVNKSFQNGAITNYTPVIQNAGNFTGKLTFNNSLSIAPASFFDTVGALFSFNPASFGILVAKYGYPSLFFITMFEGASAPIPSEIVIPTAGALTRTGHMNLYLAMLAMVVGSMIGTAIDYFAAYKLGREGVYKYAKIFRVKERDLKGFDDWFDKHGSVAVFTSRLLPVVRSAMNFPAGFSRMPMLKFFTFTLAGILVWDTLLFTFGYFLIGTNNTTYIGIGIGAFALILYVITRYITKGMGKSRTRVALKAA